MPMPIARVFQSLLPIEVPAPTTKQEASQPVAKVEGADPIPLINPVDNRVKATIRA